MHSFYMFYPRIDVEIPISLTYNSHGSHVRLCVEIGAFGGHFAPEHAGSVERHLVHSHSTFMRGFDVYLQRFSSNFERLHGRVLGGRPPVEFVEAQVPFEGIDVLAVGPVTLQPAALAHCQGRRDLDLRDVEAAHEV